MLKVEHIGIAVKDLQESIELFEKLLNSPCYKTEEVESEKVSTAFFKKERQKLNWWPPSSQTSRTVVAQSM